jgi:hypothetical protein
MNTRNQACRAIVSLDVKKIHPKGQNTFGLINAMGTVEK